MTGKTPNKNGDIVDLTKVESDIEFCYKTKNDSIPKLMGKSLIKEQFQNWTLTYTKDARWDIVSQAMKVMKRGYAKSMLNKTPAKLSIRFFYEHKDKHLPNMDNLSSTRGLAWNAPNNIIRYKGCPIKKYDSAIIDPYSQHIEFILTLDCESYRDALKLAHKLKRLKTINSVEVQIDTLKFK